MSRRLLFAVLAATVLCFPAFAQVKLVVRPDGTKTIYNVPGKPSRSAAVDFNWLAKQRDRSSEYDPIIDRHAKAYGVDPVLVKAVIQVESGYHPRSVSYKGARGLMQLMPDTARRFNVDDIYDPEANIRGGVEYLSFLLKLFSNDVARALAGYNAGEGAVARYEGVPPYEETQTYVQKALTVYYGRPYGNIAIGKAGHVTRAGGNGTVKIARSKGVTSKSLQGGFKSSVNRSIQPVSTSRAGLKGDAAPVVLGSM